MHVPCCFPGDSAVRAPPSDFRVPCRTPTNPCMSMGYGVIGGHNGTGGTGGKEGLLAVEQSRCAPRTHTDIYAQRDWGASKVTHTVGCAPDKDAYGCINSTPSPAAWNRTHSRLNQGFRTSWETCVQSNSLGPVEQPLLPGAGCPPWTLQTALGLMGCPSDQPLCR